MYCDVLVIYYDENVFLERVIWKSNVLPKGK